MFQGVVIKKLDRFTDDRGWLTEIFRNDELPKEFSPAMGYISLTKPGVQRGPHEHAFQADFFVFLGPGEFELHLWDNRKDSQTFGRHEKFVLGENDPASVIVPPGVVHGYKNVGQTDAWCLNFPNKLYKGEGKKEEIDEIRHEEDSDSRFKI
jgi:dTDP-4-dehydrorhamnose 3,5-epimerase